MEDLPVFRVLGCPVVEGAVVIIGNALHPGPVQGGQGGDGVSLFGVAADDPLAGADGDVLAALADSQPVLEIHGAGLAAAQGNQMLDGGGIAGVDDPAHAVGAQALLLGDQGLTDPGFVQTFL